MPKENKKKSASPTEQKKFFETPSFNKLQKEWYAKLKDGGFSDTETLRDIKKNNVNQQVITIDDEWLQYNDKCRAYHFSNKIQDPTDRLIFEKHCDGMSNREISTFLNKENLGLKKLSYESIRQRILRILADAEIEPITFRV